MGAHWIFLLPEPNEGISGSWMNLETVSAVFFDKCQGVYVASFVSGQQGHLTANDYDLITQELRAIAKPQLPPKPNRQLNKPT